MLTHEADGGHAFADALAEVDSCDGSVAESPVALESAKDCALHGERDADGNFVRV